ncbi:hypothetical protein ABKA04_003894 [Annulohypoxylon sp. FPYF3050]
MIILRWKPGSLITCGVDRRSFKYANVSNEDINYIDSCLAVVICFLNTFKLGISFKYVDASNFGLESFKVTYRVRSDSYAISFFPNCPRGERDIELHHISLKPENRPSVINILSHEFGHTIGMRHYQAPECGECPSVLLGFDDPFSVMGKPQHPPLNLRFNVEDMERLREFYRMDNGSTIQGRKIVDYTP